MREAGPDARVDHRDGDAEPGESRRVQSAHVGDAVVDLVGRRLGAALRRAVTSSTSAASVRISRASATSAGGPDGAVRSIGFGCGDLVVSADAGVTDDRSEAPPVTARGTSTATASTYLNSWTTRPPRRATVF